MCQLTKIMNCNLYLMPEAMPYMEKPKIIYKNLNNNGALFINHKKTALELIDKNTFKNMTCKCLYNKDKKLKRDGHVNTENMDVVKFILHKEKYVKETIEELNFGVKFIPKPNLEKKEICKIYTEAIEIYREKINRIKKHKNMTDTWAKQVIKEISQTINKADIKINEEDKDKRKHIIQ